MDAEGFSGQRTSAASWKGPCARKALLAVLLAAGCLSGPGRLVPSPLSFEEQEQQILQLAPVGTPREEAVQKLSEAGIEGSFGVSPSIYYCAIWNRPDGRRWHLNLALLFNESGELYEVRPATAETGVLSASEKTVEAEAAAGPPTEPPARRQPESAAASDGRTPARRGRRTPFGKTSSDR